jgi:hypothetical protein
MINRTLMCNKALTIKKINRRFLSVNNAPTQDLLELE